ncbi:hypothetical protein MANES_09G102300v8 [Manihot esculenta]|uniref:Uncharacterized protein n=1 Tax=Manihot esculenta TaxID=3983 RepID=A0ACB7H6B4_MANES|nr:hypothetical protein MANES_09G102300v8 [Manihot esculenta]
MKRSNSLLLCSNTSSCFFSLLSSFLPFSAGFPFLSAGVSVVFCPDRAEAVFLPPTRRVGSPSSSPGQLVGDDR